MKKSEKIVMWISTILFCISFILLVILLFGIWDKDIEMLMAGFFLLFVNIVMFYILLKLKLKSTKKSEIENIKVFFWIIYIIPMVINFYVPIINSTESTGIYYLSTYVLLYMIIIIIYNKIINYKINNK